MADILMSPIVANNVLSTILTLLGFAGVVGGFVKNAELFVLALAAFIVVALLQEENQKLKEEENDKREQE